MKNWQKEEKKKKERAELEKSFDDYVPIPDNAKLDSLLSRDVYAKNDAFVELPEGVREATDEELDELGIHREDLIDDESGFRAKMYFDENSGEFKLVFAGTNPNDPNDVMTDKDQALGLETEQYKKTRKIGLMLKKRIERGQLSRDILNITGQSLGGGQAALVGAITGCVTRTFNAAGVHKNTLERAEAENNDTSNITSYVAHGDILTYLQEENTVQDLRLLVKNKTEIKDRLSGMQNDKNSNALTSISASNALNRIIKAEKLVHDNIPKELLNQILREDDPKSASEIIPDALGKKVYYGSKKVNDQFHDEAKSNMASNNLYTSTKGLYDRIDNGIKQHGQYSNY